MNRDAVQAVEEIQKAFEEYKHGTEEKFRALEAKANRERLGFGALGTSERSSVELEQEAKAIDRYLRAGDDRELKAMSIGSEPDGGYTVPKDISAQILRVAMLQSPMRALANVVHASRANYTAVVSTSAAGGEWLGETDTRADTSTPTLAEVTFSSGELSAVAPVTRWLLEDSEYDIARFIVEEIGKQHGVMEGAAFLTGNGTNKPKGLLTYPLASTADGVRAFGTIENMNSGAAGSFTADNLIDLLYKLKPQYRANAAWMMNPTTLATIRKMKDSNGRFIWEPATQAGQPGHLFGAPVHEDPNMPVVAAGANAIVVGDLKAAYHVLDIGQSVLIRDDITTKGRVKFYVARRVGGGLVDSNAVKFLTLST